MHNIVLHQDFKTLIDDIHFNPDHPENHNIRNNCSKSYKVLKDKKWQIEPKDAVQNAIYSNTKIMVYNYAYKNLFHKIFDEEKIQKFLLDLQDYDRICKKITCQT